MTTSKKDDHGTDEVQKVADKELEQGFRGIKVDPLPNEAHSLESGPDAPTIAEQRKALADQEAKNHG